MGLQLELNQAQTLSPQMLLFMGILQMGAQELCEYIEQEMMENPVLEVEQEKTSFDVGDMVRRIERSSVKDWESGAWHPEDAKDIMQLVAQPNEESLADHLRSQLQISRISSQLRCAVECVLADLNSSGYLESSTEILSKRCLQSEEIVHQAESIIQSLDPAGVGARSLSECLTLQLKRQDSSALSQIIVREYLEDMAQGHYNHISHKTGANRQEIQAACNTIRKLDPRPGSSFGHSGPAHYVVPDVFVFEQNGKPIVSINDYFLPSLMINSYYADLFQSTDSTEVKKYLADRILRANWVIKCMEQRKSTLLRCAEIIVAKQSDFLTSETSALHPLTMTDIADELGIHVSTVSRAIKDKFVQCKRGLFPISSLLSHALPGNSEDQISAGHAKEAIRTLIEREDKCHPLSDQNICDRLSQIGISLSRRTVAKYRVALGLASAPGRRQL